MSVRREQGQGLVEYALILVLIAITVILVVSLLGTEVQGAFQAVTDAFGREFVGAVSVERLGGSSSNSIRVSLSAEGTQTVTVTDSQSGTSQTVSCPGTCVVTLSEVGPLGGTVTITANGRTSTRSYPKKN